MAEGNPFVGRWTYRSFDNDPELSTEFNDLRRIQRGTIETEFEGSTCYVLLKESETRHAVGSEGSL